MSKQQTTQPAAQLGSVLIPLYKGVVYRDQAAQVWQDLMQLHAQVADYLSVVGLELLLDEVEGYAYLRQRRFDDETSDTLPKLIQRRPLSYPVSLLCVLLRKKLAEADASGFESRVVLVRQQIVDMLQVFLPEQANEARIVEQIDSYINKLIEYGFLKKLNTEPPAFEVRRILKSLVDADWLVELDEKMKIYYEHAERNL